MLPINHFESKLSHLGLNMRDTVKKLKFYFKFLPAGLYNVTQYGAYLDPRGNIYVNIQKNYDEQTLKRGYLIVPYDLQKRINLKNYALFKGWVELKFYQSYGLGAINFSPNIKRRLIIKIYPKALTNLKLFFKLLTLIRFYDALFNSKISYEIIPVGFINLDDRDKIITSYKEKPQRIFSIKAIDLALQRLRAKVYNKTFDIYSPANKSIYQMLLRRFISQDNSL